jgi:predicted tellurium resistance membrane protein TerC
MFEWVTQPSAWVALATLTALEIVLGIDNIIFISILSGKLPESERAKGRTVGLAAAMVMRIGLLVSLAWLSHLTTELFSILGHTVTARDVILITGGLFLLGKATLEIHHNLEGTAEIQRAGPSATFASVIAQIMVLDIVFSLDSVITAIGMAEHLPVMIAAVVIAVLVMMAAAGPISDFVESHPTIKMLALSFLLLVGMALVADGLGQHVPKGYIYFAMGFSVFVEMLNLRVRNAKKEPPVHLRSRMAPAPVPPQKKGTTRAAQA